MDLRTELDVSLKEKMYDKNSHDQQTSSFIFNIIDTKILIRSPATRCPQKS